MISVERLTRSFGEVLALDDVTLEVGSGITGLLGPNGAGKTTLLRCVATVLAPDSGRVVVAGHDVGPFASRREARRALGYMPQELAFYPRFTVRRYLDQVAILKEVGPKVAREEAVDRAVRAADLVDRLDSQIRSLSGGMRRRLGIAQTLIGDPSAVVMDEPAVGLDPEQRTGFRMMVSRMASDGRAIFLSTHQIEDIAAVCHRVIVLHKGRVRYVGSIDELAGVAAGRVWLTDEEPSEGVTWQTGSGKFRVIGPEPRGGKPLSPTLEDGYLWLLKAEPSDSPICPR